MISTVNPNLHCLPHVESLPFTYIKPRAETSANTATSTVYGLGPLPNRKGRTYRDPLVPVRLGEGWDIQTKHWLLMV